MSLCGHVPSALHAGGRIVVVRPYVCGLERLRIVCRLRRRNLAPPRDSGAIDVVDVLSMEWNFRSQKSLFRILVGLLHMWCSGHVIDSWRRLSRDDLQMRRGSRWNESTTMKFMLRLTSEWATSWRRLCDDGCLDEHFLLTFSSSALTAETRKCHVLLPDLNIRDLFNSFRDQQLNGSGLLIDVFFPW